MGHVGDAANQTAAIAHHVIERFQHPLRLSQVFQQVTDHDHIEALSQTLQVDLLDVHAEDPVQVPCSALRRGTRNLDTPPFGVGV